MQRPANCGMPHWQPCARQWCGAVRTWIAQLGPSPTSTKPLLVYETGLCGYRSGEICYRPKGSHTRVRTSGNLGYIDNRMRLPVLPS
jgi:hypothetical protein